MTSVSLNGTSAEDILSMSTAEIQPSATIGIATPDETLYKLVCSRNFGLQASLQGAARARRRNAFSEVAGDGEGSHGRLQQRKRRRVLLLFRPSIGLPDSRGCVQESPAEP